MRCISPITCGHPRIACGKCFKKRCITHPFCSWFCYLQTKFFLSLLAFGIFCVKEWHTGKVGVIKCLFRCWTCIICHFWMSTQHVYCIRYVSIFHSIVNFVWCHIISSYYVCAWILMFGFGFRSMETKRRGGQRRGGGCGRGSCKHQCGAKGKFSHYVDPHLHHYVIWNYCAWHYFDWRGWSLMAHGVVVM